jgi:hydroxyethylthiazole kinase-like uncharacterized protein yjeF
MRTEPQVLTPRLLRDWPLPVPEGGKQARGSVLVVGGARATPGAVLLAGVGALRAGGGVLQLAVAESAATASSVQVPEALVVGLPETAGGSVRGRASARLVELVAAARVVIVGPGLDDVDEAGDLLRRVLDALGGDASVVLDAYALGALSRDPELSRGLGRRVVLTPNTTEAGYLLGTGTKTGADPEADLGDLTEAAARIADRYQAVTSLHGRVAAPDGRLWREDGGDVGLGTSGSGDVLAGIVAGLIARGATPEQATCWATHVHAMAGQRLVPRFGRLGYLARELLDEVPRSLAELS